MKKAPSEYTFGRLNRACTGSQAGLPDGSYVPARPMGFYSIGNRLRCAWLVFTGECDALRWPGNQ